MTTLTETHAEVVKHAAHFRTLHDVVRRRAWLLRPIYVAHAALPLGLYAIGDRWILDSALMWVTWGLILFMTVASSEGLLILARREAMEWHMLEVGIRENLRLANEMMKGESDVDEQ